LESGSSRAASFFQLRKEQIMPKSESRYVDFRAVKAAVSMEQLLSHYGILERFKRSSDSLSGPCPIHDGTNATQFRVSISKNCWNCFGDCQGGGNVLDFVARMENVQPMEAANRLVDWFHLDRLQLNAGAVTDPRERPPRRERWKSLATTAATSASAPVAESASSAPTAEKSLVKPKEERGENRPLKFRLELDPTHPYLAERGLMLETIKEFEIGYCARGVMAQRIAFPICSVKGELVGYAGRWPGDAPDGRPKYRLPDGFKKSQEIFRLWKALQEDPEMPLVIVEGFFDVMRLWQLGIRKSVALMGSSMSEAQEAMLIQHLTPGSRVIVMFDEDEAGVSGRESVLQRLALKAYVRVVAFAEHGDQPENLTAEEAQLLNLV